MQGRVFLDLAREILAGDTEGHRRAALGRAYYGLMLECRDALFRWGFKIAPRDSVHTFVRLRFGYPADPELKSIGHALEKLGKLRSKADYDLSSLPDFASNPPIRQAIDDATDALALLDAIDTDAVRRTAAVAAVRKAFP